MAECIFQRWQRQYLYPACSYVTGIANPLPGGTDYFSTLLDVGGPSDCCNQQTTEVYCGSSDGFWFGNFLPPGRLALVEGSYNEKSQMVPQILTFGTLPSYEFMFH